MLELKPIHQMSADEISAELDVYTEKNSFIRPARSAIDPNRPWRSGTPNYDSADLAYFRGRSVVHAPGSLEDIVENAVKTWEMEATHLDFEAWTAVSHEHYCVSANGGRVFKGKEAAEAGNYNWLFASTDPTLYDSTKESFESSHAKFRSAFLDGFPWEVLSVQSGPPQISFSWRHWADFNGEYNGREGDGKRHDMFGWGLLDVDENLKVKQIRIFYKPEEWLKSLEGKIDPSELHQGKTLMGSGCPFLNGNM